MITNSARVATMRPQAGWTRCITDGVDLRVRGYLRGGMIDGFDGAPFRELPIHEGLARLYEAGRNAGAHLRRVGEDPRRLWPEGLPRPVLGMTLALERAGFDWDVPVVTVGS